ncbi:MAG TPA: DegT/DnrJ/EryC1/StrS family aminotransferase [Vicinamibacterales bacterium]|nr:DegT/DnrJ/EryC1/StrS family aminotransferase [Vicinamibacterales bacterium]
MTTERTIPIAVPTIGDEEWQALREPLESGWLTQGPKVAAFEAAFAERHQVAHAFATTSCTTALHLTLAALGIGPGDEVVVPAFTWIATANAVVYCGATPVFADVDRRTYNIDVADVERKTTARTKAIVPVHLFGATADIDALREILREGTAIVEDAACAAGAAYRGRPAGGLGDAAAFSFHPRKSITTGEGGMVTTDDPDLAERIARLRSHGAALSEEQRHVGSAPYLLPAFDDLGFNYRMTDLQAAVGIVQLGRLDEFISERGFLAARYFERLADVSWLTLPEVPADGRHGWQSFVGVVEDGAPASRNEILATLHEAGVGARPGTHAVPDLGLYRRRRDPGHDSCPTASELAQRTLALPLHNQMTEVDVDRVAAALHDL